MKCLVCIFILITTSHWCFAQINLNPKVNLGHSFKLGAIASSDDGRYTFTVAGDKRAVLWDNSLKKEIRNFEGIQGNTNACAISPTGKYLAAYNGSTLLIWDSQKSSAVQQIKDSRLFSFSKVWFKNDSVIYHFGEGNLNEYELTTQKNKVLIENACKTVMYADYHKGVEKMFLVNASLEVIYIDLLRNKRTDLGKAPGTVVSINSNTYADIYSIVLTNGNVLEFDLEGVQLSKTRIDDDIPYHSFYLKNKLVIASYDKLFFFDSAKKLIKTEKLKITPEWFIYNAKSRILSYSIHGSFSFGSGFINLRHQPSHAESFNVETTFCNGLNYQNNALNYLGNDGIMRILSTKNITDPEFYGSTNENKNYKAPILGSLQNGFLSSRLVGTVQENQLMVTDVITKNIVFEKKCDYPIVQTIPIDHRVLFLEFDNWGSRLHFFDTVSYKTKSVKLDFSPDKLTYSLENGLWLSRSGSYSESAGLYKFSLKKNKIVDSVVLENMAVTHIESYKKDQIILSYGGFKQSIVIVNLKTKEMEIIARGRLFALSKDKKTLATYFNSIGAENTVIKLLEIENKKDLGWIRAHKGIISHLKFIDDDQYLVSSSKDNTTKIWDWKQKNQLCQVTFNNNSEDFAIVDPRGYYYSTKGGLNSLFFVNESQIIKFDQFDAQLNRPEKILALFPESDKNTIKIHEEIHKKRLSRLKVKNEVPKLADMPTFEINKYNVRNDTFYYSFNDRTIKNVQKTTLEINNRKIGEINLYAGLDQHIKLNPGNNSIKIYAESPSGVKSIPFYYDHFVGVENSSNLFYIGIGCSNFDQSEFNLEYAVKDIEDLKASYENSWKSGAVNTLLFLEDNFNAKEIKNIIPWLKNCTPNDVVIVNISSHGVLDDSFEYFLGTKSMDFSNPKEKGVKLETIIYQLENSNARKISVFIDACHSGEIDPTELKKSEQLESQKTDVTFRGFTSIKLKETNAFGTSTFAMSKALFSDLASSSGISIIASASGFEVAMEGSQWKNGVFTHCLKNGILNLAADLNGDGHVYFKELQNYLFNEVPKLTNGLQRPNARSDNYLLDFKIN